MEQHKGLAVVTCNNERTFETWLKKHFAQQESVWVKFAKKRSGVESITYEEAREAALRYGWIDGLKNSLDETYYLLKFSKRRPKSTWSKLNRTIVEDLIKDGRMHKQGLAEVAAAKADGRWARAYDVTKPVVSKEFKAALTKNPKAATFFKTLSPSNKFYFTNWISSAKRDETRDKRIKESIKLLNAHQKRT